MELAHRQVMDGLEGLMKVSDTIGLVLNSKEENRVLSVAPAICRSCRMTP
jgi:hypothetical protein